MNNIMEILDKLQFFGGQRAGRELWSDKPTDVQDADIESFNKNINAIRDYIQQLEAERDAAVDDLKSSSMKRTNALGASGIPGRRVPTRIIGAFVVRTMINGNGEAYRRGNEHGKRCKVVCKLDSAASRKLD